MLRTGYSPNLNWVRLYLLPGCLPRQCGVQSSAKARPGGCGGVGPDDEPPVWLPPDPPPLPEPVPLLSVPEGASTPASGLGSGAGLGRVTAQVYVPSSFGSHWCWP